MNYIIFDMEWNQPFSKETAIVSPIYLAGEIIQIGAIKLNINLRAVDCLNLLIAPTFYRKLHYRIKKMTGIHQNDLAKQKKFKEAIRVFRNWCGSDCLLLSWGYDDIQILKDNLLMHDLEEDWLPPCLNLQGIYNHQVSHENRQFSLEAAMETFQIEPVLKAHNAFNDAIYTAQVAKRLNLAEGIQNYAELNGILWNSMHSQKENFRPYRSREKAFADPKLKKFRCPICGELLTTGPFISMDEKNAFAEVPTQHGNILVKIKALQNQNKAWYIRRTIRFI
ncbi:MAG: hypothetical protein DBX52_06275 [Clostridiales bacterium]|nr:MAG: hypothetical protein DBX52_06275 [Clostridiales bacterium]